MKELYINEQTAQLILDALAWCNADWRDALGWSQDELDIVACARGDFVRFCEARGIKGVERKTKITVERMCD